jgi:hypothetical protein
MNGTNRISQKPSAGWRRVRPPFSHTLAPPFSIVACSQHQSNPPTPRVYALGNDGSLVGKTWVGSIPCGVQGRGISNSNRTTGVAAGRALVRIITWLMDRLMLA